MTLSPTSRRALTAGFLLTAVFHTGAAAQSNSPQGARNVVIVHGAWADGSSWSKVIPLLQAKGLHVVAVQNPLTSLADDVAATKRAIASQDGPVLLVGHSYGGAVITEAGNDPKVVGLVYVAALAPSEGESVASVTKPYPPAPLASEVRADAEGFLTVTPKGNRRRLRPGSTRQREAALGGDTESHSSGGFRGHNHDRRVEDQAILVRDCQQRSHCSPGASEGRSSGDESYFDHRRLQSRTNAFSPERSRRRNRASRGESREPIAGERPLLALHLLRKDIIL
jgi:pimeloyl-ACP methyl ester carboxylesterase